MKFGTSVTIQLFDRYWRTKKFVRWWEQSKMTLNLWRTFWKFVFRFSLCHFLNFIASGEKKWSVFVFDLYCWCEGWKETAVVTHNHECSRSQVRNTTCERRTSRRRRLSFVWYQQWQRFQIKSLFVSKAPHCWQEWHHSWMRVGFIFKSLFDYKITSSLIFTISQILRFLMFESEWLSFVLF